MGPAPRAQRSAAPLPGDARRRRGGVHEARLAPRPAQGELVRVPPRGSLCRGAVSPQPVPVCRGSGDQFCLLYPGRLGGGVDSPSPRCLCACWCVYVRACVCVGGRPRGAIKGRRVRDKKDTEIEKGAGEGAGRGARREARERGAGTARSESGRRAGSGRLSRSRTHPRAHRDTHTPAHSRPLPGRPGAGYRGGDPADRARSAPEPAPTSPPLRSAAARLGRRPRQSCRKMVNDRWKTMGGASQLEERPRDKPQVHTGAGTGASGW